MTFLVLFFEIHLFLSKHPFFLKLILQMDTLIVYYDQQRQIQMDETTHRLSHPTMEMTFFSFFDILCISIVTQYIMIER